MRFYTYMMRNHIDDNDQKGDLAKDMKSDKEHFPMNSRGKYKGWHRILRDYLEDKHACDGCLEVFEECWEEYVACEKGR